MGWTQHMGDAAKWGWLPHPLNEALWCWIWWYVGGMVIFVLQLRHYLLQSWHWLLHYLLLQIVVSSQTLGWDGGVPLWGLHTTLWHPIASPPPPPPSLPTPNPHPKIPGSYSQWAETNLLVTAGLESLSISAFSGAGGGGTLPVVIGIYSCLHKTWKQCIYCRCCLIMHHLGNAVLRWPN